MATDTQSQSPATTPTPQQFQDPLGQERMSCPVGPHPIPLQGGLSMCQNLFRRQLPVSHSCSLLPPSSWSTANVSIAGSRRFSPENLWKTAFAERLERLPAMPSKGAGRETVMPHRRLLSRRSLDHPWTIISSIRYPSWHRKSWFKINALMETNGKWRMENTDKKLFLENQRKQKNWALLEDF